MNNNEIEPMICGNCSKYINNKDKILNLIWSYGGIGGEQHKQWVIDQIILQLTAGITGNLQDYTIWVNKYEENDHYEWDKGIAP